MLANLYFTRAGAERITKKREELIGRLMETRRQKGEAASVGGNVWHDNFSFEQLTRDEETLNFQVSKLNAVMRRMVVIEQVSSDLSRLRIGHIAVLQVGEEEKTYRVGGFEDFDQSSDPPVISYLAPLVHDLIGSTVGSSADIELDGEHQRIVLKEIRASKLKEGDP